MSAKRERENNATDGFSAHLSKVSFQNFSRAAARAVYLLTDADSTLWKACGPSVHLKKNRDRLTAVYCNRRSSTNVMQSVLLASAWQEGVYPARNSMNAHTLEHYDLYLAHEELWISLDCMSWISSCIDIGVEPGEMYELSGECLFFQMNGSYKCPRRG